MNHLQIVCTIGPASWDQQVMKEMIEAGMTAARVNGAFADVAELDKVRTLVRNVSPDVALMVDVKGPEVRMNKFDAPISIKHGDTIVIGNDASEKIYPGNYTDLYTHISVGQLIIVGDGDVELIVRSIEGDKMICEVVFGDLLKPGKALNLPGCSYSTDILTAKDKENLTHAIKTGWTHVSASFIQDKASAQFVRDFIEQVEKENGITTKMKLSAKIENQAGIDNIDDILTVVDSIMVARGGLGIELGLHLVPLAQKLLVYKCVQAKVPVITATQMLESMIASPRPTRAEVNDIAQATWQGSDALMLSAETSAGKFPVEAVQMLRLVSDEARKVSYKDEILPL